MTKDQKDQVWICGKVSAGNRLWQRVVRTLVTPYSIQVDIFHGTPRSRDARSARRANPKDPKRILAALIPQRHEPFRVLSRQEHHEMHEWMNEFGEEALDKRVWSYLIQHSIPAIEVDTDWVMEQPTWDTHAYIVQVARWLEAQNPLWGQTISSKARNSDWSFIRDENKKWRSK